MKKILSFLSYHNAIPLAAVVLTMGAGITFAASQGVLPLSPVAFLPASDISAPEGVDAAALLAADLDAFDFHPTVTGVVEIDTLYTVSYSIDTLAPEESEWTTSSKTGEFSVAKDALGDGGLNAYVVGKLHDIENGERSYLARAQAAEKALAEVRQARPASAFAALIGLALDQIPVPVVQKPAPEPQPEASIAQEVAPMQTPQTTADFGSADVYAVGTSVATSTSPATSTAFDASNSPQATSTADFSGQPASSTIAATGNVTNTDATSTAASDMVTTFASTTMTTSTSTSSQ